MAISMTTACTMNSETSGKSTDLYSHIAQVAGDVFFEIEMPKRALIWSSDVGASLLGYDPGERDMQLANIPEMIHREDRPRWISSLNQLLDGKRMDVDFRLLRKNGTYCWVHAIGLALPTENGRTHSRIAGLLRATQEMHDAHESLYEARRMETVGNMASGIAHEFNNHLTPIGGFIEMALDYLGPDHPVSEGLQTALDRVAYCSELVGQIQAYGRKSMLMPEAVDLARLLPTTIRLALSAHVATSEQITLVEEIEENLPQIWVDQGQLQQALVHLIRNAVEAMPGGGTMTVRTDTYTHKSHTTAEAEPFVRITIADTGVGISPENRTRIFEPFFTTHGRAKARGMGLPMVQGMVAQHGGWMEIKTEMGHGTAATIYLPIKERENAGSNQRAADDDGTMAVDPAAAPGLMLIADDEPFIRKLVRKIFQAEDWEIEEAGDYNEVLERVTAGDKTFDLIILDMTMPGPSTEECLQQISKSAPDTKVLLISGYARDERIERLLAMTPSDFVSKPFSPKTLLTKVDALVS